MKKLILLLSLTLIAFVSCDGRKSYSKTLTESLSELKKSQSFDIVVFKPESPFLRETDTLLQNGFRVKIKTYTDTQNSVSYSKKNNGVTEKTKYSNFVFDIEVEKKGKLIYTDSFNKQKVNKLFNYRDDFSEESPFFNFDKLAVLESIIIDDEPLLKNKVHIDFSYTIPETNRFTEQTLIIREDGSTNVLHTKVN